MTRRLLEAYLPNKRLIERNRNEIQDEQMKEIPTVLGKVKGSSPNFPYIEQRFTVMMDEPVEADKQAERIKRLGQEIDQAEKEVDEVEQFISTIEDTRDKEVLSLRYIEGKKAIEVAGIVGYTKGRISQIVKKYIKD